MYQVSAFQNFVEIQNWLNIRREVMYKTVCVCSFDTFVIDSITVLSHLGYFGQLIHNIAFRSVYL